MLWLIRTAPKLRWIGRQRWRRNAARPEWTLQDAVVENDIRRGGGCRLWASADAGHIIGETPAFRSGNVMWRPEISIATLTIITQHPQCRCHFRSFTTFERPNNMCDQGIVIECSNRLLRAERFRQSAEMASMQQRGDRSPLPARSPGL
ncbi:hypothetical protein GCM10007880_61380 [Mesorhizobium amorphae]|nr:hypothetical protein GCM10007880_61380 [Mesorhizobium amorphae]